MMCGLAQRRWLFGKIAVVLIEKRFYLYGYLMGFLCSIRKLLQFKFTVLRETSTFWFIIFWRVIGKWIWLWNWMKSTRFGNLRFFGSSWLFYSLLLINSRCTDICYNLKFTPKVTNLVKMLEVNHHMKPYCEFRTSNFVLLISTLPLRFASFLSIFMDQTFSNLSGQF